MFSHFQEQRKKYSLGHRVLSAFVVFVFTFGMVVPPDVARAQVPVPSALNLPPAGTMVTMTPGFVPPMITGITVHPENPLMFDFLINEGDEHLAEGVLKDESRKLIKYFLASLTVPEKDLWVNLSPYEKGRIIPDGLGKTEMGRDLLAQDYLLKQLTSSLMYPEDELGKKFWDRVYAKAYEKYGTTEIPIDTFNKVWIVPEYATIFEHGSSAFITSSHLKVMMEEDYLALEHNRQDQGAFLGTEEQQAVSGVPAEMVREVLLPEIEKEINDGKTFANLRQIYNSMILATWYKQNLKESLLGQVYVDQNKTKGVETEDPQANRKIYDQYLDAFKKGVYNYIKEDFDEPTQRIIPRKYFSGGFAPKIAAATQTFQEGGIVHMDAKDVSGVIYALHYLTGQVADGITEPLVRRIIDLSAEDKAVVLNAVGNGDKIREVRTVLVEDTNEEHLALVIDQAKPTEASSSSITEDKANRRLVHKSLEDAFAHGWRVTNLLQTAFTQGQAAMFASQINRGQYPPVHSGGQTFVRSVADPRAPSGAVTYGRAFGNGLANLGVLRAGVEDLTSHLELQAGSYNVRNLMGDRLIVGLHGGGSSARNPKYTQIGKFNGALPIRNVKGDVPATLQDELLGPIAVISEVYPDNKSAYLNVNGDAIITFNPEDLKSFIDSNPDISDGIVILLRKVPFSEAPNWGVAAVDDQGRIKKFAEKPTKKMKFEEKDPQKREEQRKKVLEEEGLLVEDQYVLMNTAFAIVGADAMVRWLQLAGIKVNGQGEITVDARGNIEYEKGSVYDRALRYGGELDTFGHLIPVMAQEANPVKIILGEILSAYKEEEDHDSRIYKFAARLINDYMPNNTVDIENILRELDEKAVKYQAEIQGAELEATKEELREWLKLVGRAGMMAKLWQVMKQEGSGGVLWGAQIQGQWLDTGQTSDEVNIILGETAESREMAQVFGIERSIASVGNVGRGYESIIQGKNAEVAEDSIQIRARLTGENIILRSKSQVHLVDWPGDIELIENSVMSEGAVTDERGQKFVIHVLWKVSDNPKEQSTHYGYKLSNWFEDLGIDESDIWPDEVNKNLLTAKIFPGVSRDMIETGHHGIDALDNDLVRDLPEIWRVIQRHEGKDKMPKSWFKALKAKRLFSMSDMYERPSTDIFAERRQAVRKAVEEASSSIDHEALLQQWQEKMAQGGIFGVTPQEFRRTQTLKRVGRYVFGLTPKQGKLRVPAWENGQPVELNQPFDAGGFNFSKIKPEEVLIDRLQLAFRPWKVIINGSPTKEGHSMLVPEHPANQFLYPEDIQAYTEFLQRSDAYTFYHSLWGGASVNSKHFQFFPVNGLQTQEQEFYLFRAVRENADIPQNHVMDIRSIVGDYPAQGFSLRNRDAAALAENVREIVDILQGQNIPFSLIGRGGQVFIFPISVYRPEAVGGTPTGAPAPTGSMMFFDQNMFDTVTEGIMAEALKEYSVSRKVFESIAGKIRLTSHPEGEGTVASSGLTEGQKEETVGGINFDPALLDLQIKRDGNGVPLPVSQQPIATMNVEGFAPVIINIQAVPAQSLPLLLSAFGEEADSQDLSGVFLRDPLDQIILPARNRVGIFVEDDGLPV